MTAYTDLVDKLIHQGTDFNIEWSDTGRAAYPRAVTFGDQRHLFNPDGSPDAGYSWDQLDLDGLGADD